MVRNLTHFWETILSNTAFRTGKMISGNTESNSQGSVLSDGRWLTNEGQIVPTMAIGKQLNQESESNLKDIFLAGVGGIGFSLGAFALSKYLLKTKPENIENKIQIQPERISGSLQREYIKPMKEVITNGSRIS